MSVHRLENISKYGLIIATIQTKTMGFGGRDSIRSKIVSNNKIVG
jgi:hypothetical protein